MASLWGERGGAAGDRFESGSGSVPFLPSSRKVVDQVLAVFQLDKAIYELYYEFNNRPDWLKIPLRGIQRILARR